MATNDAPLLRQSVRWGEEYVSRALNMKMAGIVKTGVYHGFVLKPGGTMAVLVDHEPGYPRSIAVVEREGYSLTVVMDDPGVVSIPAKGVWYVCVEAHYFPTQQGYQRIVARECPESHHVVLGKVYANDEAVVITEAMITTEGRGEANADIASVSRVEALSNKMTAGMEALIGAQADTLSNVLRLATRMTTQAISHAGAGSTIIINQGGGTGTPGTSFLPDGTVTGPVAVGGAGATQADAALTFVVESTDQ